MLNRNDIENSILRDLFDQRSMLETADAFYDEELSPEESRKIKEKGYKAAEKQIFNRLPEHEKNVIRKRNEKADFGESLNAVQQERKNREFSQLNNIQRFGQGFTEAVGEGKVDHQKAYWNARSSQDLDIEAPKLQQIFGTNATFTRARDLVNEAEFLPSPVRSILGSNPADHKSRVDAGLGLKKDGYAKAGQIAGTIAGDINQDRLRSFWWLMNAPQAVTNVFQELGLAKHAPDLYSSDKITNEKGYELTLDKKNYAELADRDLISFDPEGNPVLKEGVNRVAASDADNIGKIALSKRRYRPGMVDSLGLPSAVAINAGVGLLNPLGGSNGYSAVFESDDDPTKTSNVIGEVAAKYILGRTGNLLNWDEFSKVRPDVSKDEYMRYKAFKYDKKLDLNPTDGDFTGPVGIIKGTNEGIHGPEIQFLGRSMPLLTTLLPVAAAGIGTAIGAGWSPSKFNDWNKEKKQMKSLKEEQIKKINKRNISPELRETQLRHISSDMKEAKRAIWADKGPAYQKEYMGINRVRNGIVSGLASYGVGLGAGLLLENERRRRNEVDNESTEIQF